MKEIVSAAFLIGSMFAAPPALAQSTSTPSLPMVAPARGVMSHDRYSPKGLDLAEMRPDRDTRRSIEIYNHMLHFSDCAVDSSSNRVADILGMQPNSTQEKSSLNRGISHFGGCGSDVMVNILTLERGALSEALYKSRAPEQIVPAKISATSQDSTGFLEHEQKWNDQRFSGDATMIDATNCLVAVQPAVANAVLNTRHGSDEEAAAMDKLFAGAPMCAGATRPDDISRSFLRAFIADSLYRLSVSDYREKFLPGVDAPA
jgi:hypothetical protein